MLKNIVMNKVFETRKRKSMQEAFGPCFWKLIRDKTLQKEEKVERVISCFDKFEILYDIEDEISDDEYEKNENPKYKDLIKTMIRIK